MRLIIKNEQLLPIERLCVLNESIKNDASGLSVEISRLCLLKEIRRRSTDGLPPFGIGNYHINSQVANNERCDNRDIIWGLIYAAAQYSYRHHVSNWYFLTTPGLEKVLRKGGLDMEVIGEACDHKGMRYPFKMDVLATYQSDIWQNCYERGYQAYSEYILDIAVCSSNLKYKAQMVNQNNYNFPEPYLSLIWEVQSPQ